jgi:hypothetical protein
MMDRRRRSTLAGGLLLILLGAWFLALQLVPGLRGWLNIEVTWPLFVVGTGVLLLILALAFIVGGIGVLLYWQNATGDWVTWSYAWALIPSFVGLGVLVAGLLEGRTRKAVSEGGWLILIGLVLFVVFGSIFGGLNWLGPYWPLLVVGFGLLIMVQGLLRARR